MRCQELFQRRFGVRVERGDLAFTSSVSSDFRERPAHMKSIIEGRGIRPALDPGVYMGEDRVVYRQKPLA